MNRPLSFFPGNANEDKFDTNEEIISCIQNMIKTSVHTSHFRYHIDMICACADDTKEDDENGDCFKSETSKLPSEEPAKCEPKYQNRGTNHLTIKWESATGEVQTYGVDLIVKDEIVRSKNNLRDSSTEVTFDELLPGTEYDVIIHTVTDSADTQSYPLRVCAGPEEIVGCEITHLSNRCLQLSWQRPQRHVNYFQVFYWPSGKSCSSKCEETRETLIVLSDLDPDTSYEARITTVSKERTSKHYHITFATDPGVPLGFTRIYRGLNSVNVKWNKPKGLFDHFIARWRLQDEEETNETRDTTKTQHIVPGLSSGIQYEVCVSSVSNGKENEPCSIDVQTESATITAIDIEPGVYSLKLKWKMSEGRVDRYQVQFYGPKGPQERMMCPTGKTTLQKQLTLPSHLPCEITREAYLFVPGAEQGGDAGNNQYILTDACWTRSKEWIVKFNSQELYLHRGHKIWEINLWELMTRNVQQKRSDTVGRKEALKRNQRHLTTNETGLVISMGCYGEKAKRTKTSF
ncbi:tenascin-X [Lingula anatina]|uniref:Tenascin-X n=1 Tax=Lingula anatina TaxID=7574 RepID=A0A1S3JN35_LINAN|nr:tenascin-X [Lingula anatina]|eukprot:XP_013411359.1 tenascin-X [Lingula anatina]